MRSPFSKETYEKNSRIYKLLANPIRLEILNLIKYQEANVEEIRKVVGIRKANLSQHLALLRNTELVRVRHEGQKVFYSIIDPRIIEPCRILKEIWEKKKG